MSAKGSSESVPGEAADGRLPSTGSVGDRGSTKKLMDEPDYMWPEDYYVFDDFHEGGSDEFGHFEGELVWGRGGEAYFTAEQEEEQGGEEAISHQLSSSSREEVKEAHRLSQSQEQRQRSLFVHSSPTYFPDVFRTRKSAFGSVFLRTSTRGTGDAALLRSLADSSYSMLQSLLNSFERIISMPSSDTDRRYMTMAFKESLLRALEIHGISRTFSDGSVYWNIYPVTQNYLFSLQVGDHLHQTRLLSRIEDRILNGPIQKMRLPFAWPTDSVWTGSWDMLGMAGVGTYNMPHGVSYNGKIQDGMFQDEDAMLTYPNQFKALHCVFDKGKLQSCQFQFPDLLMHKKENWEYCKFPDRRFWSEVRKGLKPAKIAQMTEHDPPRHIPQGCYDTGDGFYDPISLMLVNPSGELLRVPVCDEMNWIKKYCRKGFLNHADFRPDLFENWYNYDQDLIESILEEQAKFRNKQISYNELQQFYADLDLLPPWSKFQKRKTPSQIAWEEHLKSIPPREGLKKRTTDKKFQGHKIPSELRNTLNAHQIQSQSSTSYTTKSMFKIHDEFRQKTHAGLSTKSSKISFKIPSATDSHMNREFKPDSLPHSKRNIPEQYMKHQPLLRPPFQTPADMYLPPKRSRHRICTSRESSYSSDEFLIPESGSDVLAAWEKKQLQLFMKDIVMSTVTNILVAERERHKQRLKWAQKPPPIAAEELRGENEKCIKILEELFASIPDQEEYCDSDPDKLWNLKDFASDKYEILKYWGERLFTLDFEESTVTE